MANFPIILSHVDEHTLLICKLLVLLHLVIYSQSRSIPWGLRFILIFVWPLSQIVNDLLSLPLCPNKADFIDHIVFNNWDTIRRDVLDPPGSLLQDTPH